MSQILKDAENAKQQQNWSLVNQYLQQLPISKEGKSSLTETEINQALDLALQVLLYGDFSQGWDVAKFLPKLGQKAVAPLQDILKDEDIDLETRWYAARILGRFDEPDVILSLVELLQTTEDSDLASIAAEALVNIGESAIAALTDLLANPESRLLAVKALSQIRRNETIEPLMGVIHDSNPEVRALAVEALSSFQDSRIPPLLLKALKDTSARVRKEAVIGLGVRSQSLIEWDLEDSLQPLLYDLNSQVCQKSAIALGRIGTEKSLSLLFTVFQSPATPIWLKSDLIRAIAWGETALGLDYLQQALPESDVEISLEIIQVLGRISTPELKPQATKILIEFLHSSPLNVDLRIQQAIAQSLGELAQESALSPLLDLVTQKEEIVKLHAIAALKKFPSLPSQLHRTLTQESLPPDKREAIQLLLTELEA